MRNILRTMVAVALVGPASAVLADGTAAEAKRAGDAAVVAGEQATVAGDKATKAGEKAERAGVKAEQAADAAKQSRESKHIKGPAHDHPGMKASNVAIGEMRRADPGLTRFFEGAAGYAVFATVAKGAVGVGGAHGNGLLYERGMATGETTLTQLTVGLQLGAQAYSEIIFFETEKALQDFKRGEYAMAAQVSAVAASAGASANAKYVQGVSVFTHAKGGLMAEISLGGQKFSYRSFHTSTTASAR
jgi:lipid-binding SYLF domain-containing protein